MATTRTKIPAVLAAVDLDAAHEINEALADAYDALRRARRLMREANIPTNNPEMRDIAHVSRTVARLDGRTMVPAIPFHG